MFTGIIDHQGTIEHYQSNDTGLSLTLRTRFDSVVLGESISVDGICLTVSAFDVETQTVSFYLSSETRRVTHVNRLRIGDGVHLERALRVGDRLGGHWVTGHIDEQVTLSHREWVGESLQCRFSVEKAQSLRYLVPKGSVTLAGVSLTVNTRTPDGFSVMLVPHTLSVTHCRHWRVGESYPVEYDYLLKWAACHDQQPALSEGVNG